MYVLKNSDSILRFVTWGEGSTTKREQKVGEEMEAALRLLWEAENGLLLI